MKALQKLTGLAVLLALIINVFSPIAVLADGLTVEIGSPANGEHFAVGESISFDGNVTGGNASFSYIWLFDDGTSALSQDYSKSYDEAGDYSVTFKVTDASGAQTEDTVDIVIDAEEEVDNSDSWELDGSIASPNSGDHFDIGFPIEFRAVVTGGNAPFSYVWNFDDGTSALSSTYVKTYATAGSYTVTLQIVDASGAESTDTVNLTINNGGGNNNEDLNVVISTPSNNAELILNQITDFSTTVTGGNAPFSYTWNFGDGTSALSQSYGKAYSQTGNYQVTLSVIDASGMEKSASITVLVAEEDNGGGGNEDDELEVSNIRVTDVTQNSAIVRWTTNLGASSRVIYDTASHANLGEAPNYGYANSTETIDTGAGVTEHAVTLTGLSPATTYYFRVISER